MINKICNQNTEHHIDTFYKIAIFDNKDVPFFNEFSLNSEVKTLFDNIPDTSNVLIIDLIPSNIKVVSATKNKKQGILQNNKIDFLITPQDKALQGLLETYQNKEVVVLIQKRNTTHVFGTKIQPLNFLYEPVFNNDPSKVNGYTISIQGESYNTDIIFEEGEFNIYSRGLAFQLAQQL